MNARKYSKAVGIAASLAVLLCFTVLLAYGAIFNDRAETPSVKNGRLDLAGWDIEKNGAVALDGEWEFYWDKLLLEQDLDRPEIKAEKMIVMVPGTWDKYKSGSENFPGLGFATYRVKVEQGQNRLDGLKFMSALTSSKLFVNGKEYMSSGIVGTDAATSVPAKTPTLVRLDEDSAELDIILQVSNFTDAHGGLWEGLQIGIYEQLEKEDRNRFAWDAFMLGCLLVISIYYLSIFFLRGDSKESLYFSLGCVFIIIKVMISESYFIFRLFPHFSYSLSVSLFYISMYWGVFMLLLFIISFYPEEGSKKVARLHFTLAAAFTLFSFIAPIRVYTVITPVFDWINLAALAYITFIISKAAYKRRFGARTIILGVLFLVLSITHDILKLSNIINSPFDALTGVSAVVLVILLSIVLAARFASDHRQLKIFAGKLESMDKLKDEFLTNTSHELRTPVNAMIAITESLVKDGQADVGQKEKEDLMHVVSSGRRLVSLINDIMDYSLLKHGDLTLVRKVFSMGNLIRGVVREVSFVAAGKKINIIYKQDEGLPQVYADEYRITQVLYNLLGNAVKFTGSGGNITVSAFSDRDTVYVSVSDNGIGIPEDKIGDIFETFRQADASITREYGGMGLGLSISRSIILAHDREIQVESRPGEGSEFTFGVPAAEMDTNRGAESEGSKYVFPQDFTAGQGGKLAVKGSKEGEIVVIDDSYDNLIGVINILRTGGYALKGFTDPREAMNEIFDGTGTALAVIDVMMPELSGYDVCRKIRERFSLFELPVLLLTAGASIEGTVEGFNAGANDFLKKPFDGEELKARIKTLYDLKYATEKALNSETAFLQAQIKPHFLYNAINTIIASCHTDIGQAEEMLLDLSDYLRYLFDFQSEESLIPLNREIEAVKAYLALEKARFTGSLEYSLELKDDYENIMTPPMLIQPIVENAVRHGLRKVERQGRITIKGERIGDFYTILIEDNGAGISEEDLEKILRGEKMEGTGTGLVNVRKRLKYFYGTDIEMESTLGTGTKVTLKVKVW